MTSKRLWENLGLIKKTRLTNEKGNEQLFSF